MTDDELLTSIGPARWSRTWWRHRAPVASGVILGGLTVNFLWESIARPGLSWLGQITLVAGAAISESLANGPFAAAALDPDPLPGMAMLALFLGLVSATMLVGGLQFRFNHLVDSRIDRDIARVSVTARTELEAREASSAFLRRKIRRYANGLIVFALLVIGLALLFVSNLQAAINVAQVYRANVTILRPHVTDQEVHVLNAQFASMKTEADYRVINSAMVGLATTGG